MPDDADLVGFTMREFRRFWLALHSWSITASELYLDLAVGGVPQERCMPTQIVPERQFTETIVSITGLSAEVVNEILNRLTYDASDPKRDVFLQPLLRHSESVCWCPLVIKYSRPERNMLKLMSRSGRLSGAAANIIGGREAQMLKEFGRFLSKRAGYDYKINTTIRWSGQTSEIDLLAYNKRAPTEILLVEAKAILAVDDVGEVHSADEHMRKAKRQLERGVDILKTMPQERKEVLFRFVDWDQITVYRLLVITPDSSPLGGAPQEDVSVITLELLRTQLRNRDLKTPTALWEACKRKRWLKPFGLDGEDFYLNIKVGRLLMSSLREGRNLIDRDF